MTPAQDWRFPFVTVGNAKGRRAARGGFAVTIETDYGEFASSSYSVHDIAELESVVAAIKADFGAVRVFVWPATLAVLRKARAQPPAERLPAD